MFKTLIKIKPEDTEKITKVCKDIQARDNTFGWDIKNGYLAVNSENKDQAYKRGEWMRNKVEGLRGTNYKVVWHE